MLWLYRVLFAPAFLFLLPSYLRRMRKRGGYGESLRQRFGRHRCPPRSAARRVWIQAVSVGEMLAIAPVLRQLKSQGIEVYLTTTTSTGYRLARERYAGLALGVGYFPIDWWPFSRLAWRGISPDAAVIMEGERWPEHLHQARRRRVRTLCINARLSDRSFARLRKFPVVSRLVFKNIDRLLASSPEEAERFVALGYPERQVRVSGNLKFDVELPQLSREDRAELRRSLGLREATALLVGASTWPGEEAALVAAMDAARASGQACVLLIVPRHAERRDALRADLAGRKVHFRSQGPAPHDGFDIAVADTTGELQRLVQLADIVFVGKSLPPHTEGQTPVEAAAAEKPIIFGPGMSNFRGIAPALVQRGAARQVADGPQLASAVVELIARADRKTAMGTAASKWHAENRGSVGRTIKEIYDAVGAKGA